MMNRHGMPDPEPLITPQEITDIMSRAGTTQDIYRAVDIANEYIKRNNAPIISTDWQMLCMLANIYQAGRIQGIREERAKQAAKGAEKFPAGANSSNRDEQSSVRIISIRYRTPFFDRKNRYLTTARQSASAQPATGAAPLYCHLKS